ncbi:thermonuclease family protein [Brachyspira innocens]|uniref:thermonuclease family protein n=1 Tax=Brachyspira innocens TaxID=13264 RepID=UPI00035F2EAF|nr:thermonuclease family protein [Brachyspira innocens]
MKKLLLIYMVLSISLFAFETTENNINNNILYNIEVIRIYDGDTFFVNIPDVHWLIGSNISVRIRGIATPEIRGGTEETKELARKSKEALIKLFEGRKITLYNLNRDKYFRILADVKADNIDVKDYMIKNNYAKPYNGGTKDSW